MNIQKVFNNKRVVQAMLGTSKEEFERLLPQFEKVFIETKLNWHKVHFPWLKMTILALWYIARSANF